MLFILHHCTSPSASVIIAAATIDVTTKNTVCLHSLSLEHMSMFCIGAPSETTGAVVLLGRRVWFYAEGNAFSMLLDFKETHHVFLWETLNVNTTLICVQENSLGTFDWRVKTGFLFKSKSPSCREVIILLWLYCCPVGWWNLHYSEFAIWATLLWGSFQPLNTCLQAGQVWIWLFNWQHETLEQNQSCTIEELNTAFL